MTVILKIRFYICPCLRMKKNKTMKKNCFLLLFLLCACLVQAQDTYRTDKDVVAVNYRLSPKAKNPAYIEDAAEAVAWTFRNIEKYGGRKDRIFVSGHSAGGYLTLILAMDKKYMAAYGADADSVAAYLPVSGQTVTHFTIRKERGLPNGIPIIDEFAPVNKARKDTAPVVLITGDKNLEMADRYEENALLASVLKNIGNRKVSLYELQGFDHGQVLGPACYLIVNYVKRFK